MILRSCSRNFDCCFSAIQSCPTLLWLPGLQHTRHPSLSQFPIVCSNACPLNWWCRPTISSSVTPFSSCPQSFPASWCFPELALCIRLEKSSHFSFSISASKVYSGLVSWRINWFDLLQSKGPLRVFSSLTVWRHQFFSSQPSWHSNSHIHIWLLDKP